MRLRPLSVALLWVVALAPLPSNAQAQQVLPYRIISREDQSYPGVQKMAMKVLLTTNALPRDEDVQATLFQIWSDGNRGWNAFRVWAYLPGMDVKWGAYGTGEFTKAGLQRFYVEQSTLYGTKWWPQIARSQEAARAAKATAVPRKATAFRYDVYIEPRGRDSVQVSVLTNLPEGTRILVSADRSYWQNRKRDEYSGAIFERDIPVVHGRVDVTFAVNDARWLRDYSEKFVTFKNEHILTGIRKISPNVQVSVLVSPRRDQPAAVLTVIGADGQYLGGLFARSDDVLTALEARKALPIKVHR